jgi:hypothetical protein
MSRKVRSTTTFGAMRHVLSGARAAEAAAA